MEILGQQERGGGGDEGKSGERGAHTGDCGPDGNAGAGTATEQNSSSFAPATDGALDGSDRERLYGQRAERLAICRRHPPQFSYRRALRCRWESGPAGGGGWTGPHTAALVRYNVGPDSRVRRSREIAPPCPTITSIIGPKTEGRSWAALRTEVRPDRNTTNGRRIAEVSAKPAPAGR